MWESANTWERLGMVVLLMGSIVDIFQFTWIIKKAYSGFKRRLYDRVRKEILLDQMRDRKEIKPKEEAPFIGQEDLCE